MEGAGAIFYKKHGNGKNMKLIPLTSKDATKMVLGHIRDTPRTIERRVMMMAKARDEAKVKKEPKKKNNVYFLIVEEWRTIWWMMAKKVITCMTCMRITMIHYVIWRGKGSFPWWEIL